MTFSIQGSSIPSTSRYRNSTADNAWFCVLADTLPSLAKCERKASTSGAPIRRGCRFPLAMMNRLIQYTYACSVRKL